MGMAEVWHVLQCSSANHKPRQKLLLISLANFANEKAEGWASNATLAGHAGVSVRQVRNLKRGLEASNLATFSNSPGRGKAQNYQLNMAAIINGKTGTTVPLIEDEKGEKFLYKRGNLPHKKGKSNVPPITDKRNKRSAQARPCDDFGAKAPYEKEGQILVDLPHYDCAKARTMVASFASLYGKEAAIAWIEPGALTIPEGKSIYSCVWTVGSAFREAEVERRFWKFLQEFDVAVVQS